MTFYATTDSDGTRIRENAAVLAFETREQAVKYLLKSFPADEWDRKSAVIEPGRYGDCWVRAHKAPVGDEKWLAPFSFDDLYVAAPGQHPGGHVWWIEPRPEVLIVSYIGERAQ